MNNPVSEIPIAIRACAGAATADAQIAAFYQFFVSDASFLHPLCYVPPSQNSRSKIIGIFLFYRAVIPITEFDIEYIAFDERVPGREGHLFVDLIQRPYLRGISWAFGGWRPAIPMHVNFQLQKNIEGNWKIKKHEDVVQPMSVMLAFPPLRPLAYLFYWLCEIMGLLSAWLFVLLGVWRPEEHMKKRHPKIEELLNSP